MTIASEITRINNNIANAYTSCNTKGATMPATQNSANLATCIDSIPAGGSGDGIPREVVNGKYSYPASSFTFTLPSTATDLDNYSLYYAFNACSTITAVDMSSLTSITGSYALHRAFDQCSNLTSVDLSNLSTVAGNNTMNYAFDLSGITSLDLSSLTSISYNALGYSFYRCRSLQSVDLSSLVSLVNNAEFSQTFSGCSGLTSINLSSLNDIASRSLSSTFTNCTSLTSVDLSSLTTLNGIACMSNCFSGCTSLASVDLSGLTTFNSAYDTLSDITGAYEQLGSCFSGCTNLTTVKFDNLETIGVSTLGRYNYGQFYRCFYNCSSLTSITFPKLQKIYCGGSSASQGTFASNNKVEKFYFPMLDTINYVSQSYTTACENLFYGCDSLTELHFAAANQAAIEASPGYSTAWGRGAGNVTIYFDL